MFVCSASTVLSKEDTPPGSLQLSPFLGSALATHAINAGHWPLGYLVMQDMLHTRLFFTARSSKLVLVMSIELAQSAFILIDGIFGDLLIHCGW